MSNCRRDGQVLDLKANNHEGSNFENISNLWHLLGTEFSHGVVKLQSSYYVILIDILMPALRGSRLVKPSLVWRARE